MDVSEESTDKVKDLLNREHLAVLGTSDHGHPYTSLVIYAVDETVDHLIFFTRRNTQKYRNIKSDGRVSVFVDSREKWAEDPSTIEGVSLAGVAWEVKRSGGEFDLLKKLYLEKNPQMDFFAEDRDSALFKINIEMCKYVVNFDEAQELSL